MIKALVIVFLFLSKTIIPKPEFTNKPESKAPKGMLPFIYKEEIRTLLEQLGIKPIIEENNGVKYLLEIIKLEKFSSPTWAMIKPKDILITKT